MRAPRLSLATWIALPTIFVVAGMVMTLTAMQLDVLIRAWLTGSMAIAELAGQQVKQVLVNRLEEVNRNGPARSLDELKVNWANALEGDEHIASILEAGVGRGASIVEISITDESDVVLASSNRARRGRAAPNTPSLEGVKDMNFFQRIEWLFSPSSDYEFRIPIGLPNEPQPLFYIQVLVSNVLLRAEIVPGIQRIAVAGGISLAIAMLLVYGSAKLTAINLQRLGNIIDRIESGEPAKETASLPAQATEFAAVESKLTLLGDRVRGALLDARAYRERVGTLLDRLQEAILLFDADRLVLSAGPVESLLSMSPAELTGSQLGEVFPRNSEPGISLSRAWATGESIENKRVAFTRGNTRRELLVNVDFIADLVNPDRRLALLRVRDAESAGEVESQLQISSRLEAINRLTGGVAHEIKNPLNSIAARLALLESIVSDEAPEAAPEIQVISEEIYRLDRVVRTFLDFTQPLQIKRDRVDLVELMEELVRFMRPDASNRNVEIQFDASARSLPVRGDRDLLKQAIMNLIVNGIDAMPHGGQLRIAASEQGGICRLRLTDTGTGIPEPMREKIFQLYFTTKRNGSGIGLATAYRTLQIHGGAINVESEVGRGSTFELVLPIYRAEVVSV